MELQYTKEMGRTGRVLGFLVGAVLAAAGLLALAIAIVALALGYDSSALLGAGISGFFAITLGGYGADMLYRAHRRLIGAGHVTVNRHGEVLVHAFREREIWVFGTPAFRCGHPRGPGVSLQSSPPITSCERVRSRLASGRSDDLSR